MLQNKLRNIKTETLPNEVMEQAVKNVVNDNKTIHSAKRTAFQKRCLQIIYKNINKNEGIKKLQRIMY